MRAITLSDATNLWNEANPEISFEIQSDSPLHLAIVQEAWESGGWEGIDTLISDLMRYRDALYTFQEKDDEGTVEL